jgi:hypothetical protein
MPYENPNLNQAHADHIGRMNDRQHLDMRSPANIKQDFDGMAQQVGQIAAAGWRIKARGVGKSDAQVAVASQCATTAFLNGFYRKDPLEAGWADGRFMTITDQGVHVGAKDIEYATGGAVFRDVDDGITSADDSPERAVRLGEDTTRQRFETIKHKMEISWQRVQTAMMTGQYNYFEELGMATREQHRKSLNNLIRRGNAKYGLSGITNHPGIRRFVANVNWDAGTPAAIYAEFNEAVMELFASPTEEKLPTSLLLARRQWQYWATQQFDGLQQTKLLPYTEDAYKLAGLRIESDPGLATSSSLGGPCALIYTNRPDLVSCTMPLFGVMQDPIQKTAAIIEMEIWSRFAGVQVRDVDMVQVVDGDAAGWLGFGAAA